MRLDRIRNGDVRERFGVAAIADKFRETHLRCYGHVLQAGRHTVCKLGLDLEVPGKRPRRLPKQRFLDVQVNLKHVSVHSGQVNHRAKWRQTMRKAEQLMTGQKLKRNKERKDMGLRDVNGLCNLSFSPDGPDWEHLEPCTTRTSTKLITVLVHSRKPRITA